MSVSVNTQSDFKLFETAKEAPYTFDAPFRFVYYTSGATSFEASYKDGKYANCKLLEDGRLMVVFDNPGFAPGRLLCRREFYLTDEDFADGVCKMVLETRTDVYISDDGDDVGDIDVELPPYYQKGDKGESGMFIDAPLDGTYPQMTVGFAENIVGDGSATSEVFSFRPTAGENRNTLNDGAARIEHLKGSSVVWNNILTPRNEIIEDSGITLTNHGTGKVTVRGTATAKVRRAVGIAPIIMGHKYAYYGLPSVSGVAFGDQTPNLDKGDGFIATPTYGSGDRYFVLEIDPGVSVDFSFYPKVTNLTQMFGANNEPTTVAEFYQRKPIGVDLSEYNVGEIVDGNYKAIKTTGYNQWDEEWELGVYNRTTGKPGISAENIRCKNRFPVIGGASYYVRHHVANNVLMNFMVYDENDNYIGYVYVHNNLVNFNGTNKLPSNARWGRFFMQAAYGITYLNDICISLYWPTEYGDLYGTYKPYKPFERDLSWIGRIKDSNGNLVFPNGMRSAGTARDEIRFNSTTQKWEAVRRVGVVDLGSLSWEPTNIDNVFYSNISTMRLPTSYDERKSGMLCSKYAPSTNVALSTMLDKSMLRMNNVTINFYIKDTAFTSSIDFKAAMQGVKLNYELAEPIVTPITENINLDYDVSDYGTEELIVAEGVESAPLSASIEYSPNVLAVLKNAPVIANDVDMLKSQLAALTAQLAALTATNNNE